MSDTQEKRQRVREFIDLAHAYTGNSWTVLAKKLDRTRGQLREIGGNPKLDFVRSLADALDWSVGDVAEDIVQAPTDGEASPQAQPDFDVIDARVLQAHGRGDFAEMIKIAQQLYRAADTPERRALACNRIAGGWDGLGRYAKALDVLRQALRSGDVSPHLRLMLQSNLANTYYSLWMLLEARGISRDLVEWYEQHPPKEKRDRATQAFAHYVRGHTLRRLIAQEPDNAREYALRALADLELSESLYLGMAKDYGVESYAGVANTCRGGIIEVECELGRRKPQDAIKAFLDGLDQVLDTDTPENGDWMESFGWWSIFGCNVALRHLSESEQQQPMAIFTNKAYNISNTLENWAMRERAFTMEHARRVRFEEWTKVESDWALDKEDIRVLAGTMGRFPGFRTIGWDILRTARVVATN
jgi:tetratricopeptide (TPR) repeat protein